MPTSEYTASPYPHGEQTDGNETKDDQGVAKLFPIVGIGASAGGPENLTKLFREMPSDTGMAFVLIQHLTAAELIPLLSHVNRMPVVEITDGCPIQPNHIYIAPLTFDTCIAGSEFGLQESRKPKLLPYTINFFFRSLASHRHKRAMGVILSGTGSDGASGITEIKAEGGVTFAQDERSAQFSEMPRSAIATDCVDFVLRPEAMAAELARMAQHAYVSSSASSIHNGDDCQYFRDILKFIHKRKAIDFTSYKHSAIQRRISRRMMLVRRDSLKEYARFLEESTTEVNQLYHDLFIRVTSFFRDPEVFDYLKNEIFPKLIETKASGSPLTLWVAGCASGEEVYSLAMCLSEYLASTPHSHPIKIFGTDISATAIAQATRGFYNHSALASVPGSYVEKFFSQESHGYSVKPEIREMCEFSTHNVIGDTSFSGLDLVSCRNLLIYLDLPLQKRVVSNFRQSLLPDGYLLLGSSESIGWFASYFERQSNRHSVYLKKAEMGGHPDGDPLSLVASEADKAIVTRLVPAALIVNDEFAMVEVRGDVAHFLEPESGRITADLLSQPSARLPIEIRSAMQRSQHEQTSIRASSLGLTFEVIPFRVEIAQANFYAVLFWKTSDPIASI